MHLFVIDIQPATIPLEVAFAMTDSPNIRTIADDSLLLGILCQPNKVFDFTIYYDSN